MPDPQGERTEQALLPTTTDRDGVSVDLECDRPSSRTWLTTVPVPPFRSPAGPCSRNG